MKIQITTLDIQTYQIEYDNGCDNTLIDDIAKVLGHSFEYIDLFTDSDHVTSSRIFMNELLCNNNGILYVTAIISPKPVRIMDNTIRHSITLTSLLRNQQIYGPIADWDVSFVTDMSFWFTFDPESITHNFGIDNYPLNPDISQWDVSSVQDFTGMFMCNHNFNQNITGWNVSSAATFEDMFLECDIFNQDISGWNHNVPVSKMINMFNRCFNFEFINNIMTEWDIDEFHPVYEEMFWETGRDLI